MCGSGFHTSQVNNIKRTSDGGFIVSGNFVKLTQNGAIDISFMSNMGTGLNNSVMGIDIQSDNTILLGGYFTTMNGTSRNNLVR